MIKLENAMDIEFNPKLSLTPEMKELWTEILVWLEFPNTVPEVEFDMEYMKEVAPVGLHECKTICCIAGAALIFSDSELPSHVTNEEKAACQLGFYQNNNRTTGASLALARKLFYVNYFPIPDLSLVTREMARETILDYLKTGEVTWKNFPLAQSSD